MVSTNSNKKLLVGLGNPIMDISNETTSENLEKFGLKFGQTVFANDENVGFFDVLESSKTVEYVAGGSITNAIRVTNWMLQNSKDHGCMLVGCIGNDEYGKTLTSDLSKVNVEPLLEVNSNEKTSRCGCAIFKKERCLMPQIRASNKLSMEYVNSNLNKILEASILFIEGYFIIEKFDIVEHLVKKFKDASKEVAFTLSAVFMIEFHWDKIKQISDDSNIIFCNDEEAEMFVKKSGKEVSKCMEENVTLMHQALSKRNRLLVITCGKNPVIISRYNYDLGVTDFVLKSNVYKVEDKDIVDTNACGDSFAGGFLSQYLQGKSLDVCARAGNFASGVIIKETGCSYPEKCDFK